MIFKNAICFCLLLVLFSSNLLADLSISSISKTQGGTKGFSQVAIYGSGFSKTAEIYFGDERVILDRWVRADLMVVLTTSYPREEIVDVKIVQGEDTAILENAFTFQDNAPTLTSIKKNRGLNEGGAYVRLIGNHFTPSFKAFFGDEMVSQYIFFHDSKICVKTPANSGVVDVMYENEFGQTTLDQSYEYYSPDDPGVHPEITKVLRTVVLPDGQAIIPVKGNNFSRTGQWQIGGIAVAAKYLNPKRVYLTTPELLENEAYSITYTGENGNQAEYQDALESVAHAPVINQAIPSKGFVNIDTYVQIKGQFLTDDLRAFIGDQEVNLEHFYHDGKVLIKVTPQTEGIYDLKLISSHGETILERCFEFVDQLPRIDYLWPSTGQIEGGTRVTVRGNNFDNDLQSMSAELNGVAQSILRTGLRSLIFETEPVSQKASVDLRINTSTGEILRDNAFVYDQLAPSIEYVKPLSGPSKGKKFFYIYGNNFTPDMEIELAGITYTPQRFYHSGMVRIKTQASPEGAAELIVSNDVGQDTLTNAYTFVKGKTKNSGEPMVTWLENPKSPLTGNTPIHARGKQFGEDLQVFLNGKEIEFTRAKPTSHEVKFNTPAVDAAGSYSLTLVNQFGETVLENVIEYVEEAPVFLAIKENDGFVHGDTFFTIQGKFLTPSTEVTIDGRTAKLHYFKNSTVITFQSTGGSLGTHDIELKNEYGTTIVSDAWNYKGIAPAISKISPSMGEAEGGNWVHIHGKYFSPDAEFTFNGMPVLSTVIHNTRSARVKAPDNSNHNFGLVDVEVQTAYGEFNLKNGYYYKKSTMENTAPEITSSPVTVATEDIQYTYQVQAEDAEDANDGENLSWALSGAPSGMTISATGLITWTPTEGMLNSGNITVSVADGGENGTQPDSQTFAISVTPVNDGPVITTQVLPLANWGSDYSTQLLYEDPDDANDGVNLFWSLVSNTPDLSISPTGLISWANSENSPSSGSFTVQLADGGEDQAAISEMTYTISKVADNTPPALNITNPDVNGLTFTTDSPTFMGTFSDNQSIDHSSFTFSLTDDEGNFLQDIDFDGNLYTEGFEVIVSNLEEGSYHLEVSISDYAGNQSTDTRTFSVDLDQTPDPDPVVADGYQLLTVRDNINPQHLRVVDVNKDGKPDIVYKEINDGKIKVIYQN